MKKTILTLMVALFALAGNAQIAPNTYLIHFKDKADSPYSIDKPEEFLSQKALDRRKKYGIKVTEQDLPVNPKYLKKLEDLGMEIHAVSKWMNLAVVYTKKKKVLKKANKLKFVIEKELPRPAVRDTFTRPEYTKNLTKTTELNKDVYDYGKGKNQAHQININELHALGFEGQGMTIAVLDAGFYHCNKLPAFDSINANKQIIGVYDFVDRDNEVYDADTHGMMVLSNIAGNIPGKLVGTAPKADFWLFRTEKASSEYITEEYFYIAAAEKADSLGCDILHSSLGYADFDDKVNSHTYADMNGNTAPITIGADIAASKGMLVVTSAGNEGNDPWKYVSAPGDADSVLTVGAVRKNGKYGYFSSRGPSSDGRVKPDVVAQGVAAAVQGTSGNVTTANGTSFSGPIMAGAVTCLWQANPSFNNMEIIQALRESSSQYSEPDSYLGFGIPDMLKADAILKRWAKERKK